VLDAGLWGVPFSYVLLAAYSTVLVAELVGDKAIYTVASLALRFRPGLVFGAITVAFMGKMLGAVLLGRAASHVLGRWTTLASAAALFASALFIWLKEAGAPPVKPLASVNWSRAIAVSFSSLFFTEWGDAGQVAAAALAAQTHSLLPVWLGGTLALMSKGGLAIILGLRLRHRLPQRLLRPLASVSCCLLGVLALLRVG